MFERFVKRAGEQPEDNPAAREVISDADRAMIERVQQKAGNPVRTEEVPPYSSNEMEPPVLGEPEDPNSNRHPVLSPDDVSRKAREAYDPHRLGADKKADNGDPEEPRRAA